MGLLNQNWEIQSVLDIPKGDSLLMDDLSWGDIMHNTILMHPSTSIHFHKFFWTSLNNI